MSRTEKLWRWCRRNPVVAGLMAAAALFLLAGTGISSYFAIQANRKAAEAFANADRAAARGTNAAEARANLYIAHMNLAQRAWEIGNVAHVLELLKAQRPTRAGEKDLRGWEWYYQERSSVMTTSAHSHGAHCFGLERGVQPGRDAARFTRSQLDREGVGCGQRPAGTYSPGTRQLGKECGVQPGRHVAGIG